MGTAVRLRNEWTRRTRRSPDGALALRTHSGHAGHRVAGRARGRSAGRSRWRSARRGVALLGQPVRQPMEPVAGPSVSARPAAMARYSSAVSSTSCRTSPSSRDRAGTAAPGTRTMRAWLPTASRICVDELEEGRPLGSDRRRSRCRSCSAPLADAELGQVVDVDGPDPVVAPAADGEDRQAAQQPGDVVDEHAVAAEEDGRAQDGVRTRRTRPGPAPPAPCPGSSGRGSRRSDG